MDHEQVQVSTREASPALACPYKGLLAYGEADAEYFFGRDADRELIVANLIASKLTILYGASGVGKSSVLRAAVLPDLRDLAFESMRASRGAEYVPVVIDRWSGNVRAEIHARLAEAVSVLGLEPDAPPPVDAPLPLGLARWAAQTGTTLLVILDQFEEFLLYQRGELDRPGTGRELAAVLSQEELPANFLIAIREDAVARLDRFKGFVPQLFDNYLRLSHLDAGAAFDAIERPIAAWNVGREPGRQVRIESALTAAVIKQVAAGHIVAPSSGRGTLGDDSGNAVEAPFLQLVMTKIWAEEHNHGSRWLRLATLDRLGGAERIVRTHLDDRMQRLSEAQRDIASQIFHQLVTPSGTKVAHRATDLAAYSGIPAHLLQPVLDTFASGDWRIVRVVDQALEPQDEPLYEIFHDVLAQAVLEWRVRHEERRAALAAVHEERRLVRQRRRRFIRRIAGIALVALLVTLAAIVSGRRGDSAEQAVALRLAENSAESRSLATEAQVALRLDPDRAARLAWEAMTRSATDEAAAALRSALFDARGIEVLSARGGPAIQDVDVAPDGRFIAAAADDANVLVWRTDSVPYAVTRIPQPYGPVVGLRISPDGQWVATVDDAGDVRIWDARTGDRRRTLGCETARVRSALRLGTTERAAPRMLVDRPRPEWTADGSSVVMTCGTIARIASVASGRVRHEIDGGAPITAVAAATDSDRIAVGTTRGSVLISDARQRKLFMRLRVRGAISTLNFSADGTRVASGSARGAWLHSVRSGRTRRLDSEAADAVAFTDDGRLLATGTASGRLNIWVTRTMATGGTLNAHAHAIRSIAFSSDGSVMLTAGNDQTARLWDVATLTELASLRGHRQSLTGALLGAGRLRGKLVTASSDGSVRIWRSVGEPRRTIRVPSAIESLGFVASTRLVWTLARDGAVNLWDSQHGTLQTVLGASSARHVSLSDDGARAIVSGHGSGTRIVSVATGRPQERFAVRANAAAFSPDGRAIATASGDGTVSLLRLRDRKQTFSARAASSLHDVLVSDDGRLLIASGPARAYAWSIATGKPVARLVTLDSASDAATHTAAATTTSSGAWLLAISGATAQLISTRSGKSRRLETPGALMTAAAITHDGTVAVTGSDTGLLSLWDTATGHRLGTLRAPPGRVSYLAFSSDGRWIAAAGAKGRVGVFRCEPCLALNALDRAADRR